jgi:tetratricopeptide (TPR) repeat protein
MFRKALLAAALFFPAAAQAEWHSATSNHFIVYSEENPENLKEFTERLERFDQAMRAFRLIADQPRSAGRKVTIYRFGDVGEIADLSGQRNVAGFYIPRAEGSVAFVPRRSSSMISATDVLLHEYTHDFMFSNWTGAAFPAWFVEGFAEFHATAIFRDDGSVIFGANPEHRRYGIGQVMDLPLDKLLTSNVSDLDEEQVDVLYGRGWLLTHYLTFDADRRRELGEYIGAINSGKTPQEAAKLLSDITDIGLNAYGRRPKLSSALIPADKIKVGPIAIRNLTAGEEAVMPARIRSQRGVDRKSAPAVAALARKLAAPFPNDPGAQTELAEAEFDAERYADSAAAADRALAADPKRIGALIYRGMASMELAKKNKATDAATWHDVRHWFLAANKVDSEDPEPLILFYSSFGAANQKPTANAESGLLYAYALAPHDLGLRWTAGKVLLQQGKAKEARAALAPIAYHPHGGTQAKGAQQALTALDREGAPAALKSLAAFEKEQEQKAAKGPKAGE